eukprot:CAMPEP_0117425928 /NCGR_PEP_ID=MMETSP0758-20121206/6137_1 /TAXON_ID=63605 /ORGANISM="Percolomonas cosmopolitus, Strain AE-1 (ATCC 50343)" /LENGTH=114 /DNA_ID=CAMNT_0005210777 /DNA_START=420 /DNA_END=764 /DNA_ORIENTATION=+
MQGVDKVFSIIQCPDSYELTKPENPEDKPLEELDYQCKYIPKPDNRGWYIPLIAFSLVIILFITISTFVFFDYRRRALIERQKKAKEQDQHHLILTDSDEIEEEDVHDDIMDEI